MNREGIAVARCTVERLMRQKGLCGVRRGKVIRTTTPDTSAPCPLDRVNRQFNADRPNQLWVSDFTYVSTWQGWLFVAFVIDVYARRIVGWRVTKLRIFKTRASRYWQVRCYLRGKTYTQSLKTTNKSAAISQAKQFFHIKTAELYGEHVVVRENRPVIFNDLVVATLAQQQARVERGELTALSLAILLSRLSKNIQPCFGAMPIDTINYQHLTDFVQRLNNKGLWLLCC